MEQDEPYVDIDNLSSFSEVYRNIGSGDSGGPVMRKITDSNGEERYVIVAVSATGYGIHRVKTKCISEVCKITEEVVKWIW